MAVPVVELRSVFCVHRTGQGDAAALQGAELTVEAGEVLCVLGPSGAGKSTLLSVIAGLQIPSAGIVRVMGQDIGRRSERARGAFRHRHLGSLSQWSHRSLPPDLPVARAVELPLLLRRQLSPAERAARALGLLSEVGLDERAGALPDELSGGERQRAALCAAVAHRPTLLLADEPTGELDSQSAGITLGLIARLARVEELTVIIATHDPATAMIGGRTVTIAGGRIAEEERDRRRSIVVDQAGWLRVPPRLRASAGIGEKATLRGVCAGVLIGPIDDAPRPQPVRLGPPSSASLTPARVEVCGLRFAYGPRRPVLQDVSHRFAPGRMTVIGGRSGSGKSTLLRLLAGLCQPQAGELTIDGQLLGSLHREQTAALRRELIGYMAQEPTATPFLSASENLVLAQQIRGVGAELARVRAEHLLDALAMSERVGQLVSRLSAGETQRVALGRALAGSRGLLLLDEPTSRLDEASAGLVARVLAEACREGHTIICASHDPQLLDAADELLHLR